jgi:F0F1-type ATP synthase assembly protein I
MSMEIKIIGCNGVYVYFLETCVDRFACIILLLIGFCAGLN